jgi:hypothetical protein
MHVRAAIQRSQRKTGTRAERHSSMRRMVRQRGRRRSFRIGSARTSVSFITHIRLDFGACAQLDRCIRPTPSHEPYRMRLRIIYLTDAIPQATSASSLRTASSMPLTERSGSLRPLSLSSQGLLPSTPRGRSTGEHLCVHQHGCARVRAR